jgi:hypothetical protein
VDPRLKGKPFLVVWWSGPTDFASVKFAGARLFATEAQAEAFCVTAAAVMEVKAMVYHTATASRDVLAVALKAEVA